MYAALQDGTLEKPEKKERPEGDDVRPLAERPPLPKELVPFDLDGDGVLSATEQEAVKKAIADGTLTPPPPPPRPPVGDEPTPPRPPDDKEPRPLPDVLKPFDKDGDGKLNEAEQAAVKAAIEAGTLVLPQPPKPPIGDEPTPPRPPENKESRPLPDVLKPFDKDGDGKLNETEKAAVKAAIEAGTLVLPPPPQPPQQPQPPKPPQGPGPGGRK